MKLFAGKSKTSGLGNTFLKCWIKLMCYWGDQIKEDEMGGACGTHGREEKFIQPFG
jgi:hypothetical protein